jgi:hypothetical protein
MLHQSFKVFPQSFEIERKVFVKGRNRKSDNSGISTTKFLWIHDFAPTNDLSADYADYADKKPNYKPGHVGFGTFLMI